MLPVAVNLGAPNLLDLGLPGDVHELLAKWDVGPSMLQLEITETIVAADPVRVIEIMKRLGELGISLSLDDFGTGSSSLAYLRELPVQELKIDKSFILGMDEDAEAAMIVAHDRRARPQPRPARRRRGHRDRRGLPPARRERLRLRPGLPDGPPDAGRRAHRSGDPRPHRGLGRPASSPSGRRRG